MFYSLNYFKDIEEYPMSNYFWSQAYCAVLVPACTKPFEFIFKTFQRNSPLSISTSPRKIALLPKRSHMNTAFMFSNTLVFLGNSDTFILISIFSEFQQQQLKKLPKESLYCSPLQWIFFAEQWQRVSWAAHLSFETTLLQLHFLCNRQIWYCVATISFCCSE